MRGKNPKTQHVIIVDNVGVSEFIYIFTYKITITADSVSSSTGVYYYSGEGSGGTLLRESAPLRK